MSNLLQNRKYTKVNTDASDGYMFFEYGSLWIFVQIDLSYYLAGRHHHHHYETDNKITLLVFEYRSYTYLLHIFFLTNKYYQVAFCVPAVPLAPPPPAAELRVISIKRARLRLELLPFCCCWPRSKLFKLGLLAATRFDPLPLCCWPRRRLLRLWLLAATRLVPLPLC